MKSFEELQRELKKCEDELALISKKVTGNTPFMSGQLDGKSEGYNYIEYSDPSQAKYLISRINYLKSEIENYGRNAEAIKQRQEQIKKDNNDLRKEQIASTAQTIYSEQVNEYMNKNLWGKAKSIFTGKKPKKLAESEIIKAHGESAASRLTNTDIQEINRQREEQINSIKERYANDPEKQKRFIEATNKYFDEEIEKITNLYNQTLSEISGGRGRK